MTLKGYITRRDEDGTHYLANEPTELDGPTIWTQSKSEASHNWLPKEAEMAMATFEEHGHYFVRYTAALVRD